MYPDPSPSLNKSGDGSGGFSSMKLGISEQIVASSIGGTITALVVTPLDVVKTRLQAQGGLSTSLTRKCEHPLTYDGTFDAFTKIGKNEGFRSFWRGLGPTLLMNVPSTALYLTFYENIQHFIADNYGLSAPVAASFSGSLARTVSVFCTSPIDLFRTNLQSHSRNIGSIQLFSNIVRSRKITTFWVGVWPTLCRDVPFSSIYWTLFETFRQRQTHSTFFDNFVAGALSGAIASASTVPFDVVKTRMQMNVDHMHNSTTLPQVSSVIHLIRDIVRKEGFATLFQGVLPRVAKIAPACAITISTYECFKDIFLNRSRAETTPISAMHGSWFIKSSETESNLGGAAGGGCSAEDFVD